MVKYFTIVKMIALILFIQLSFSGSILAQNISVSPSSIYRGITLTVTISGEGTTFGTTDDCACPTCRKIANKNTYFKAATWTGTRLDFVNMPVIISPTRVELTFNVPVNADYGYYDLTIAEGQSCKITKAKAISIGSYNIKSDSLAMLMIYSATDNEKWNTNTNWVSDQPVGTWYGVTVEENRISGINLSSNNLSGSLPNIFHLLVKLQEIDFSHNQLTSSGIMTQGYSDNLTRLILNDNQIEGTLSNNFQSPALIVLNLENNKFHGELPTKYGDLDSLEELYLSNNNLSGDVISELSNLTKLRILHLRNNKFAGLLPDLSSLENLDTISLENNMLEFDDLEPNYVKLAQISGFTVYPQDSVGSVVVEKLNVGDSYKLTVDCGGTHNNYQWFKNGSPVSEVSANPDFNIKGEDSTYSGTYVCHITNSVVDNLTLYSRDNYLNFSGSTSVEDRQDDKFQSQPSILSINPNPANTTIEIIYRVDRNVNVNIQVYNLLGELIFSDIKKSFGVERYNWVIPNTFVSGTYRVICRTSGGFDGKILNIIK